jgi:poly(3-hydroxyalkanoate) depolymerase
MEVTTIEAGGNTLRVATTQGAPGSLPLLVFNGLGANLELLDGFAEEMQQYGIGIVTFDVPGVGGSSSPLLPYRLWGLARIANVALDRLGIAGQVDVAGVSWGGALAQEFAHRYPKRVRRLLLAATTAGAVALPGRWSALSKMIVPRRYGDPAYLSRIGGDLYGGRFRDDPTLLQQYGRLLRPPKGVGYYFQLLAGAGWTSVPWLWRLRPQTLVMMGTDDPIVPLANGRLLAALIPNARLWTIDDGHLFLVTSRRACAPIIAKFLNEGAWPQDFALAAS